MRAYRQFLPGQPYFANRNQGNSAVVIGLLAAVIGLFRGDSQGDGGGPWAERKSYEKEAAKHRKEATSFKAHA